MSVSGPPRTWPVVTIALVVASAVIELLPALASALRFERDALLAGEPWRFFTGHLVHGSSRLALLDLAMLSALGAWWELRSRAAFVAIVIASASFASAAVLAWTDLSVYVGSSALSSGLFVAAALELGIERGGVRRVACGLALALFAIKCVVEARGYSWFASLPNGMSVCAQAHALGGAGGAFVALFRRARSPGRTRGAHGE